MVDARLQRGARTRQAILQRAGEIASVEGLNALTIGRVAADLDVSKSGLFAHFGSKEEFQLATIDAAAAIFVDHVMLPAEQTEPGIRRVWAMCESWLRYSRQQVFPGGCFFLQVAAEYDAVPGRIRDAIALARARWVRRIEVEIEWAQEIAEIGSDTEPAQLAFELDALVTGANGAALLHDDPSYYDRARAAVFARLSGVAVGPPKLPAVLPPTPPSRRRGHRPPAAAGRPPRAKPSS